MDLSIVLTNLATPPVLFFILGMAATLLRSDLEIPQPVTRALSLYLLFSIGMHGGAELAMAGLGLDTLTPLLAGIAFSALLPISAFFLLRPRVGSADAAGIGATYGSISAVTFITACSFLDARGTPWSGHMVAAMALMESPAILVGVALARRYPDPLPDGAKPRQPGSTRELVAEAFLNGPVFLLVGSLVVGLVTGKDGWEKVEPFAGDPFQGVLCLFLLDMGLIAAKRLKALRQAGPTLGMYAVAAPLVHAALAIAVAHFLGLAEGDAVLLTVLCASASYIAVPAAIRIALPEANPSVFLPMSLAMTFPFNIAVGIPLYATVIGALWGPA